MPTRSQHLYEFGPYRLDTAERLLLRDGEPVALTPKAFETLAALVERSGHLIEKDELMKVVWADAFVEESNLTNNVYALRKLLGSGENGRTYIETVPKRGYRFTAPVKESPPETLVVEKRTLTRVVTEENVADHSPQKSMIGAGEAVEGFVDRGETLTKTHTIALAKRTTLPWLLIALLSLSLIIAGFFIYRSLTVAPRPQIESIAVLPFRNESGNPDLEYLSDDVTEALINSLSQLSNLSVKARTTVFRYKGKEFELQRISSELSVEAIVTGRVVQHGDDLVLYLSLVDARNGNQLWGEQYNRKLTDLVAVQNEIARDVSHKLRARLSGADERRATKAYTTNVEAYQLFLKGRFHVEKFTPQDTRKALAYFQQAIALDPNFAAAYANLAGTYLLLAGANDFPSRETILKAKENALKALSLDDQLSTAHEFLGFIHFQYDYDFVAAEHEFKRALELDPNDASAHESYGVLLSLLGRHEEALSESRQAAEINPLSPSINSSIGMALIDARRYDEAIAQFKKALELDAYFIPSYNGLAIAYQMQGNYAETVQNRAKILEMLGNPQGAAFIRESFAARGWQGFLRAMIESQAPQAPPYIYIKATMYAELGENDKALEILNQLYQERSLFILAIKVDPRLDKLRSDTRFQDLLRRVGLTP